MGQAEVAHPVVELPRPHPPPRSGPLEPRGRVPVEAGDGLGDLAGELTRGQPPRLREHAALDLDQHRLVGDDPGLLHQDRAVRVADLPGAQRRREPRERRREGAGDLDRLACRVPGGAAGDGDLVLECHLGEVGLAAALPDHRDDRRMPHRRDPSRDPVQRPQVVHPHEVLREVPRVDRGQQHQVGLVHPTTESRHQLVVAQHRLVPRRRPSGVEVVEQAGLAIGPVQLRDRGGERLLLRGRPDRQPVPAEVTVVPVGRGPWVGVGVLGHGTILEHQY